MSQEDRAKMPQHGELIAGRFRITETLGHGGFSTVYKAHQESIGRDVAIKFLAPQAAQKATGIERFRREALHISQLHHPNTIRLYDYGQTPQGLFFIVMEFAQGRSLGSVLAQEGGLGSERGLHLMTQICQGMAEAHSLGIVHRDLKPENIFVCDLYGERDVVKVLDFGLARSEALWEGQGRSLTGKGRAFGTPMYMAPEQIRGETVTPASDVYALGLLLFELLTGRRPVEGKTRQAVLMAQLTQAVPELTPELRHHPLGEIIAAATAKKLPGRLPDAGALLERLLQARDQGAPLAPAPLQATLRSAEQKARAPRPHAPPPLEEHTRPQIPLSTHSGELMGLAQAEEVLSQEVQARGRPRLSWRGFARQEEFEALQVWSRSLVRGGKMKMAVMLGEAGSGKSRLLRTWRRWAQQEHIQPPLHIGVGYCQRTAGHSLAPLREALREALHSARVELEDLLQAALERRPHQEQDSQALAQAAAFLRSGEGGAQELGIPMHLVAGLGALCLELARRAPLVLVLEDIDQGSEALCALARDALVRAHAKGVPLGIILLGRRDRAMRNAALQATLERIRASHSPLLEMPLEPLSQQRCDAFVSRLMEADEGLKALLFAQSRGNPLFVVHLLRYLHAQDWLRHNGLCWSLAVANTDHGALPASLPSLLRRRLDQAVHRHPQHPGLRLTLQWLALLGQRSPASLLHKALRLPDSPQGHQRMHQELELLAQEGLIELEKEGELQVVFDHLLVREALLEEIATLRAAPRLHRAAAEVKLASFADQPMHAPLVEIAQHYRAAGDQALAHHYLRLAADRAYQRQETRRARDLYRAVARGLAEEDPSRGSLWLALGKIEEELGESGPAEDHYRWAAQEGQRLGDAPLSRAAFQGLARVLALQGHLVEATDCAEQSVRLARAAQTQEALLEALVLGSQVMQRSGLRQRAQALQREIRGLLSAVRDPLLVARARLHIGGVAREAGQHDAASLHLSAALESFTQAQDSQGISDAQIDLGALALDTGQPTAAQEHLERALHAKQEVADRHGVAQVSTLLAQVDLRRGDLADAERHLLHAEELWRALGARHALGRTLSRLGELRDRLGDPRGAHRTLKEAQALLEDVGDQRALSACLRRQGLLALGERDRDAARELLRRAHNLAQPEGPGPELYASLLDLALVASWDGKLETSGRMLREVLAAPEAATSYQRKIARAALGVLLLLEDRQEEAEQALGELIPMEQGPWPDGADRFLHGCMAFYAVVARRGDLLARLTPHCYRLKTLGPMSAPVWLAWLKGTLGGLPEQTPEALRLDAEDGLDALRTLLRL